MGVMYGTEPGAVSRLLLFSSHFESIMADNKDQEESADSASSKSAQAL